MKITVYRLTEFERRMWDLAKAALAAPKQLEPSLDRGRAVLRTWRYPSFDHYQVWLLLKESRGHSEYPLLRRVVWNHAQERKDLAQATDPEDFLRRVPSRIEVTGADVDVDRWHAFEEAAAKVVIPPLSFPGRGLCLDGMTLGIEHSFFSHSLRLEWRPRLPAGWQPLTDWTMRVQRFFEKTLGPSTRPAR